MPAYKTSMWNRENEEAIGPYLPHAGRYSGMIEEGTVAHKRRIHAYEYIYPIFIPIAQGSIVEK
jgi:hypothetical protein